MTGNHFHHFTGSSFVRLSILALVLFLGAVPGSQAHGVILIWIQSLTQQINATTNHSDPTKLAHLYLERGELYRLDQNWPLAAADYNSAERFEPQLPKIIFCRAMLMADSGDLKKSIALLNEVLAQTPTNGEAWVELARVKMRSGDRNAAIKDYETGLNHLSSPAPDYILELAQAYEAEGNRADALRSLNQGITKLGPVIALESRALELNVADKQYDEALARLSHILAREKRKEKWFAQRGDILLLDNQPIAARNAFQEALAAINKLPPLLQKSPSMIRLQAHINHQLAELPTTSICTK